MGDDSQTISEINTRIRDLEEKQQIMKERVLLVGQTLVDERTKTHADLQEIKRTVLQLVDEQTRIKELLQRLIEQSNDAARKQELAILERQLNLLRAQKQ